MQAPLLSPTQIVIEDWIDYNGHLNMAFYNVIFDRAVDHFYDLKLSQDGVYINFIKN